MVNKYTIFIIGASILAGAGYVLFSSDRNDDIIADLSEEDVALGGVQIIAFGDSLTAGYGLSVDESYPMQLEAALKAEGLQVSVVNAGLNGETTQENVERALSIRSQNPDIVLLGIGGNDALRSLPVTQIKENILASVRILKGGDNPPVVILLEMQAPITAGLGYKKSFDALYEDISESEGVILLPFFTTEIFLDNKNKIADGIHLNQVGYKKVVDEYLLDTVAEVVEKKGG